MEHKFKTTTFTKPTYCDVCDKFIWGLIKQGEECRVCGMCIHPKCSESIPYTCSDFRTILYEQIQEGREMGDVDSDNNDDYEMENQQTISSKDTASVVQQLMRNTALNSVAIEKSLRDLNQPLNLVTTTPKNMMRFTARAGVLLSLQDAVIDLLVWKTPSNTILAMVAYTTLCLYPQYLLMVPHFILLYILFANYYKKTKRIVVFKSKYSDKVQYLKNMQFIQNFLGLTSEIHDQVQRRASVLTWDNEEETLTILKWVLISAIMTLITIQIIPINYLLLSGLVIFFANTAFFQATCQVLGPLAHEYFKKYCYDLFKLNLKFSNLKVTQSGSLLYDPLDSETCSTVVVFENQRWWAGLGWIHHLLRTERNVWSDESGEIAKESKAQICLPCEDWEWVEDWKIDHDWAKTDEEGWVYSDHYWRNPSDNSNIATLTRRRKWCRRMTRRPEPLKID